MNTVVSENIICTILKSFCCSQEILLWQLWKDESQVSNPIFYIYGSKMFSFYVLHPYYIFFSLTGIAICEMHYTHVDNHDKTEASV